MLVLRRLRATDVGEIAAAVSSSMEHLRPWMPWATPEAADLRTQRARVAEADEMWAAGTDYIYSVFAAEALIANPIRIWLEVSEQSIHEEVHKLSTLARSSKSGLGLPKRFDDENFDFYGRKLTGQPEQAARWKRCSNAVNTALGEALGQVYVSQYFAGDSKAKTLEMVHDIESAMARDLDQLDWMSPETRTRAKEKLHMIANKIGYPDKWRDYSKLEIKADEDETVEVGAELCTIGDEGESGGSSDEGGGERADVDPDAGAEKAASTESSESADDGDEARKTETETDPPAAQTDSAPSAQETAPASADTKPEAEASQAGTSGRGSGGGGAGEVVLLLEDAVLYAQSVERGV